MPRAELTRHRFTVDDVRRMAEVGVLSPDAKIDLLDGEILHLPKARRV